MTLHVCGEIAEIRTSVIKDYWLAAIVISVEMGNSPWRFMKDEEMNFRLWYRDKADQIFVINV